MDKKGYVYLLINNSNKVIYTGVTSNLVKRIYEHQKGLVEGFSKRYNLKKLVHYEIYDTVIGAITREKQIKAGSREKKIKLIKSKNPTFRNLSEELL